MRQDSNQPPLCVEAIIPYVSVDRVMGDPGSWYEEERPGVMSRDSDSGPGEGDFWSTPGDQSKTA